ncbi:Recombination endonuclease VII [Gordonia westfalica]|uniref:Recombination endonuclease VII n=1 Tax=Gordonia westfalica TaxID=158898 RepID=A0A1H2DPH1_9ACTN|nr:Recombination endonuclease VII [Gordonia westfalica]SDT84792.1 Recombination endonuclease VII [Gordonia westfalica]SDT84823.1 Recombination endonuclease VII [Gordonia westfalica]SDT85109.1 Recombination endonuclease VII [Gordonia westfalica]SDT94779.1 Recombination endonuclease VII [Gordonia westfalica]
MKATRTRRPCPTCGSPIDRGPGQHAYCSDECRPICEHPTCDRPTRGMQTVCDSHRVQLDRHGELRPDTWSKEWVCVVCGAGVPKGSGRRKHCSRGCQQTDSRYNGRRPTTAKCRLCGQDFSLQRRTGARLQRTDTQWCRTCGRESPEARRYLKYGITPEEYAAAMNRGCDICGERVGALHIDHDHSCCPPRSKQWRTCGQCVRGFLCGSCNRGLGLLKDDPNVLRSAIEYLGRKA